MKRTQKFRLERPKEYFHWAYRREMECTLAQIRRHIEENQIPGWEEVARRDDGSFLPHKIMKFDKTVEFQGKQYKVLFLENWFYDEDEIEQVDKLWFEMEG